MLMAHEVNALNLLNNPRVGWDILLIRRRLEVSLDLLGGPCHLIFFAGIVLLVVGRAIFVGRLRFLIIQRLLLVFERPSTSLVALHLLVPVLQDVLCTLTGSVHGHRDQRHSHRYRSSAHAGALRT
jgi:hypothetical protein